MSHCLALIQPLDDLAHAKSVSSDVYNYRPPSGRGMKA